MNFKIPFDRYRAVILQHLIIFLLRKFKLAVKNNSIEF